MEGMTKGSCLLCHNSLNGTIVPSPYSTKVFNNCCGYLNGEVIKEFSKQSEGGNFQFCPVCFQFGEQLFQMHEQLEEMKKEIKDFVQCYVSSALKVRQTLGTTPAGANPSPAGVNPSPAGANPSPAGANPSPAGANPSPGASLTTNDDSTSNSEVVIEMELNSVITQEDDTDIEIKYETRSESVSESTGPNQQNSTSQAIPTENRVDSQAYAAYGCEEWTFSCEACKKKFPSNYDLQVHFSEHVGTVKMVSCDACGDGFFNNESLQKHQLDHINQQNYPSDKMILHQCGKCPLSFFNVANLEKHQECHNDQLPLQCQVCLEMFPNSDSLGSHNCKRYDCTICLQSFRSKIGLQHHQQTLHARHHKCINCGMQFRSGREYKEHRESHIKEPCLCIICNKTFPSRNNLRQHFAENHS